MSTLSQIESTDILLCRPKTTQKIISYFISLDMQKAGDFSRKDLVNV
jgi:hypothetical protein